MAGADKAAARVRRRLDRQMCREQRWREIRCWWTWPFRHEYVDCEDMPIEGRAYEEPEGMMTSKVCVGCGKRGGW